MIVVMPDKMNGENHSLVRLFLKRGFMKELDLTQSKLSDLTGIGKSSISQYLSGKNEPSKDRKQEIARALGVQDLSLIHISEPTRPY